MSRHEVPVRFRSPTSESLGAPACRAPEMNLYLFANGDMGPCCRNRSYGNVADGGLKRVWTEVSRRDLVRRLSEGDYSQGCQLCGVEHRLEGKAGSFTAPFDAWFADLGLSPGRQWPARIEFELSNTCNLQCVQCNGELSSAIRSRREHRRPLQAAYDDDFFEELREFLPHLELATFVGGEPFLTKECFRVWDLVAELSPELDCAVVTNGTQWNARVESVLERVRVRPYVSLDGMTASTYESIRHGSDFELVLGNIERFRRHAERRGTTMAVVFCLMSENAVELADVLLYAEERDLHVDVSVVRQPERHSVGHLPLPERRRLLERVRRRGAALGLDHRLERNLPTWVRELERLSAMCDRRAGQESWSDSAPRILMFDRDGARPVETDAGRGRSAGSFDRQVPELHVSSSGSVTGNTVEVEDAVGLDRGRLAAVGLPALQERVQRYEIVEQTADRYEASFTLIGGRTGGSIVMVPVRDDTGWCDSVTVRVVVDLA